MRIKVAVLLVPALALMSAGCGKKKHKTSSATTSTAAPAPKQVGAPGAKVSFVTPKNGSTVSQPVVVKVKITKFKLAPQDVGKPAIAGEGHLHFSLDGGKFDDPKHSGPNGQLAVKLGVQGKYSPSVAPTITYSGLPKGKHTLLVYLANNDHTNTGVQATTTFTVK